MKEKLFLDKTVRTARFVEIVGSVIFTNFEIVFILLTQDQKAFSSHQM